MPMPAMIPATTATSVREIAAAVRFDASHQLAETALQGLRRRRDTMQAEMAEHARIYRDAENSGRPVGRSEIDRLTLELRKIENEIATTRPKVMVMRAARAGQVRQAIQPMRQEAARKALAAIAALDSAMTVLSEIASVIRTSGDANEPPVPVPPVASVNAYAARIIG